MGRLTESRHLEELSPAGEGAVFCAPFLEALGHRLVEPRDVAEERGAGGVGIDADVVHTTLHHRVERGIQMPGFHVMLIETDADVRRLDLHQFRKRVLETTADRHRTTDGGLVVGEFLAGVGARRIDARPCLVDDAVGDVGLLEGAGDQFSDEGLGLPTGRAITDRDHVHAMFLDELDDPCAGCLALLLLADDRQHGMLQRHPTLVDHDRLAAALESGVEGEHPLATDRGLEEKIPQIAGKHGNGVPLAVFGDFPADLPLEAREHKSSDGVTGTSTEEIGVRMGRIDQESLGRCLHLVNRTLDPHLQQPGPFTTIDCQGAVRGDPLDVLGVFEVIAVVLFVLGEGLPLRLHPLAGEMSLLGEDRPQGLADIGPLGEHIRDDVPDAEEGIGDRCHLAVGIDEVGGAFVEIGCRRVGGEDLTGEGLEPPLPGNLRQRELPWLEGKVKVFELLGACGSLDPLLERLGKLSLPLDRAEDRLLAVGDLPSLRDRLRDPADVDLVEPSGLIAPITRQEGNGVPLVEESYHRIDTADRQVEFLGNRPEIDERHGCDPTRGPGTLAPGLRSTPPAKSRPTPMTAPLAAGVIIGKKRPAGPRRLGPSSNPRERHGPESPDSDLETEGI